MTITWRAALSDASKVEARPTGPHPCTTTVWPGATPPRRATPPRAVGMAQPKAITASGEVPSGMR